MFKNISKYMGLIQDISKYSKYFKESSWASFLISLWMYNGWKDERWMFMDEFHPCWC